MDIVLWLRSLGLGKYEAAFRENEIDETVLPSLTEEHLKQLGVTALGHRVRNKSGVAAHLSSIGRRWAIACALQGRGERKERHTSPAASQTDLERIRIPLSGSHFLNRAWLAQCIAASPHRFDVILAARCVGEFPSQLADKHVDDLGLRLIHAAIEMVQETFFGERRVLAQCKELQDFVFLAGQMHTRAPDLDALPCQWRSAQISSCASCGQGVARWLRRTAIFVSEARPTRMPKMASKLAGLSSARWC